VTKMNMLMHAIYFVNFQLSWGVQSEVLIEKMNCWLKDKALNNELTSDL
jgi:hypothetical protein